MIARIWIALVSGAALLSFLVLGGMNLFCGDINQDEGWYLYAARLVHLGELPYRDFAFTQPPFLPLVYSAIQPFVDQFGLMAGRVFTLFLGFLTALGAGWLGSRLVPRGWRLSTAVMTFVLIGCNVYHSYFTTIVKTYSLCAFLLVAGLLLLSYASQRAGAAAAFLAGLVLAMAAATRISAAAALPVAFFYLIWKRKDVANFSAFALLIGGTLGVFALFLPFYLAAPDGFWFAMVEYHTLRHPGSLAAALVYKAGFLSRVAQDYFVAMVLWIALIIFSSFQAAPTPRRLPVAAPVEFPVLLWSIVGLVSLVHFMAPFPYDDYQVIVMPIFLCSLSVAWTRRVAAWELRSHDLDGSSGARSSMMTLLFLMVFVFSTLATVASPVNQDWFIRGRDRIWWRFKEKVPLLYLQQAGRQLQENSGDDKLLLTQDIYLAVESGLRVPRGMEMGPFSYYPEWDRERCEAIRVLNREMLEEMIDQTEASLAAFSGYGLSIQSPEVSELPAEHEAALWQKVNSRYEEMDQLPFFGQAHTTLRLLRKKNAEDTQKKE